MGSKKKPRGSRKSKKRDQTPPPIDVVHSETSKVHISVRKLWLKRTASIVGAILLVLLGVYLPRECTQSDHLSLAENHLKRGNELSLRMSYAGAVSEYEIALEHALQADNPCLTAKIRGQRGSVVSMTAVGNSREAQLNASEIDLDFAYRTELECDEDSLAFWSLMDLAGVYHQMSELRLTVEYSKKAMESLTKAQEIARELKNESLIQKSNLNMGVLYLLQYSNFGSVTDLRNAITLSKLCFDYFRASNRPTPTAEAAVNLGLSYTLLSKLENPISNLRAAIRYFDAAKVMNQPEVTPQITAKAHTGMCEANIELFEFTRDNQYLKEALREYNEANAYSMSALSPNHVINLAISACRISSELANESNSRDSMMQTLMVIDSLLTVCDPVKYPRQRGAVLHEKGNIYFRLSRFEAAATNLKMAIRSHREGLIFRTRESYPVDFALSQANLAFCYFELAKLEHADANLSACIECAKNSILPLKEGNPPVWSEEMDRLVRIAKLGLAQEE